MLSNEEKSMEVAEAIVSIATCATESNQAFRSKAKEIAGKIGSDSISIIPSFFHYPPSMPEELKSHFNGLGSWLLVCQFASFELLYHFGRESLPIIKEVAFGEYDWTQGNALELLVRFAADNIEREQIVEELNQQLPDVRYEALHYAIGPLLAQSKGNPKIGEVLELITAEKFRNVLNKMKEK